MLSGSVFVVSILPEVFINPVDVIVSQVISSNTKSSPRKKSPLAVRLIDSLHSIFVIIHVLSAEPPTIVIKLTELPVNTKLFHPTDNVLLPKSDAPAVVPTLAVTVPLILYTRTLYMLYT